MKIGASEDSSALLEAIPEEVSRHLGDTLPSDEELRFSVSTDMGLDGTYATGWLAATADRLIACDPTDTLEAAIIDVPLGDIVSVQMRDLTYGNNILKVRTADRGIEVARFTKSLTHK